MWGWGGSGSGSNGVEVDLGLELIAKFSVLLSLLVVIYFFVATTYRIARLPVFPFFYVHNRQELHKTATPLPFTFQLEDGSINDMDSFVFRLTLISSEQDKPRIKCLWGVDANYLCGVVASPSWENDPILSNATAATGLANSEEVDKDKVLVVNDIKLARTPDPEVMITVTTPAEMDWSRINGQYKYPLAIFFSLKEGGGGGQDLGVSPTAVVGLCVVLHVKSPTIPRSTAVLAQYIKLANGLTHKLQPLYVVDGVEIDPSSNPSSSFAENEPFGAVMCLVCQTFPVSRAIVPCGHISTCAQCFQKLVNCPMCRGPITYFFKTRSESYLHDNQPPTRAQ